MHSEFKNSVQIEKLSQIQSQGSMFVFRQVLLTAKFDKFWGIS